MLKHGTASEGRVLEWALTVARNAPRDLSPEVMDAWDKSGEEMKQRLCEALASGPSAVTGNWLVGPRTPTVPPLSFPALQAVGDFENWFVKVLELNRACHLQFFGQEFDLTQFEATLKKHGPEKMMAWLALDLETHFLPRVAMSRDSQFPGWKVRPNDWYWQQLQAGKVMRNRNGELVVEKETGLEGITVLVDTRLKPKYNNGKQMWEGDTLLGPILIRLREEDKIAKYEYSTQGSRFGVSVDEWEEHVRPALAEKLGLPAEQVRLERTVEAKVIPQLFSYLPRRDDGKTSTWVWYEEFFGGRSGRLGGGGSDDGGLAGVSWREAWDHWDGRSVRPLAVL